MGEAAPKPSNNSGGTFTINAEDGSGSTTNLPSPNRRRLMSARNFSPAGPESSRCAHGRTKRVLVVDLEMEIFGGLLAPRPGRSDLQRPLASTIRWGDT